MLSPFKKAQLNGPGLAQINSLFLRSHHHFITWVLFQFLFLVGPTCHALYESMTATQQSETIASCYSWKLFHAFYYKISKYMHFKKLYESNYCQSSDHNWSRFKECVGSNFWFNCKIIFFLFFIWELRHQKRT